jgi:hypothetical protein
MKRPSVVFLALSLVAVAASGFLLLGLCGCEDDKDNRGADTYFDENPIENDPRPPELPADMTLNPSNATLNADAEMQAFDVQGGVPPYVWSAHDTWRGEVVEQTGSRAVYQRRHAGDNAVIVQDGQGMRAYGVVRQP